MVFQRRVLAAGCLCLVAGAADARVWILPGSRLAPHAQALAGAQARLGKEARLVGPDVPPQPATGDVILTFGAEAARRATGMGVQRLVACMLNDRSPLLGNPQGNAVLLDLPPEAIAARLARALPKAQRVSLLLERDGMLRAAMISGALREQGFTPRLHVIKQLSDLGRSFTEATTDADVVLAMPDAALLPSAAMRGLLLTALHAGVPVIGPSADWARAGALYALEWDYEAFGLLCADEARKLERGGPSGQTVSGPAGRLRYTVNRRSLRNLGLDEGAILEGANEVIE